MSGETPGQTPRKRQRLDQDTNTTNNRPSMVRRKSSPDLLDTTVASPVDHQPRIKSALAARRSSIRRPPLDSLSPRHRLLSPSARPDRESQSPDPLDTITPDLSTTTHPRNAAIAADESGLKPAASAASPRSTRHSLAHPPVAVANDAKEAGTSSSQDGNSGRRSLRSRNSGSRAKCELASYFYNYEELLSLEPPEIAPDALTGDTTIHLIDDLTDPFSSNDDTPDAPFGNPLLKLHDCEVVTIPTPKSTVRDDPLNEDYYSLAHKRVERKEKQIKNIERERAQHEKEQLDRLLDDLKGHDWTRAMGLTGISDAEKKLYEPKRAFFVEEITALIDKFHAWRDEEKRRKLGKAKLPRAETTPPGAAGSKAHAGSKRPVKKGKRTREDLEADEPLANGTTSIFDAQSTGEQPDANDVDAWAARQLIQEAQSASVGGKQNQRKPSTSEPNRPIKRARTAPYEPPPVDLTKPFTSFYADHATRHTALSGQGSGLAFGYPIPQLIEQEFRLPRGILREDAIVASQRTLRRLKRDRG